MFIDSKGLLIFFAFDALLGIGAVLVSWNNLVCGNAILLWLISFLAFLFLRGVFIIADDRSSPLESERQGCRLIKTILDFPTIILLAISLLGINLIVIQNLRCVQSIMALMLYILANTILGIGYCVMAIADCYHFRGSL